MGVMCEYVGKTNPQNLKNWPSKGNFFPKMKILRFFFKLEIALNQSNFDILSSVFFVRKYPRKSAIRLWGHRQLWVGHF